MNKKWLLGIILLLTFLAITIVIVHKSSIKYNKLIVNESKWNSIISSRKKSTSINFESIEFNDYDLQIDNENNTIYYSIVNLNNKNNPSIKYKTNKKVSIAINDNITEDKLEDPDKLKIMVYNNNEYKIYSLVVTNYPILSVTYKDTNSKKNNIDINVYIFDNHVDSPQRVLKSDGKLKIIDEDKEYSFSLKKESLGHNKRKNHISIFGMEKRDEYLIKVTDTTNENEKYVHFFINGKYKGLYTFGPKDKRINYFKQNKENNK